MLLSRWGSTDFDVFIEKVIFDFASNNFLVEICSNLVAYTLDICEKLFELIDEVIC